MNFLPHLGQVRDVKAQRLRKAAYAAVAVVAVAAGAFGYTSVSLRDDVAQLFKQASARRRRGKKGSSAW